MAAAENLRDGDIPQHIIDLLRKYYFKHPIGNADLFISYKRSLILPFKRNIHLENCKYWVGNLWIFKLFTFCHGVVFNEQTAVVYF